MRIVDQNVEFVYPRNKEEAIEMLQRIEFAGRNCYKSYKKMTDDSYDTFINDLMKREHYSPLEFGDISVVVKTSRDVMAELTRHRLASFCIESQRYVNPVANGGMEFIKPVNAEKNPEWFKEWQHLMFLTELKYDEFVRNGVSKQDARKILPNSTACTIVMKANIREWLHILKLRTSEAAYPEMRQLANMILDKFIELFPNVFGPLKKDKEVDIHDTLLNG